MTLLPPPKPIIQSSQPNLILILDAENSLDLQTQEIYLIDEKLIKIYNDTIHLNDGSYMHNNIDNYDEWQTYWRKIISLNHQLYTPPQGKIGSIFINQLTEEWKGARTNKWNSERPLLFPILILQKSKNVIKKDDIKQRILFRIDAWSRNPFQELVEDTFTDTIYNSKPSTKKTE